MHNGTHSSSLKTDIIKILVQEINLRINRFLSGLVNK